MEYDISFQRSIHELTELTSKIELLGASLDNSENKTSKSSSRIADAYNKILREVQQVTNAIVAKAQAQQKSTDADETAMAMAQNLARVEQSSLRVLESLARQHADASVKAAALSNELGGLKNVLEDTAALRARIKWEERRVALMAETVEKNKFLQSQLATSLTTEAQSNSVLQQRINNITQLVQAESRLHGQRNMSEKALKLATSEDNTALQVNKERLRAINQMLVAGERNQTQTQQLQASLAGLSTTEGQRVANLQQQVRNARNLAIVDEKRVGTLQSLANELNYVQSAEAKQEATLRAQIRAQQKLNSEEARAAISKGQSRDSTERLTMATAKQIAKELELADAIKRANQAMIDNSRQRAAPDPKYALALQNARSVVDDRNSFVVNNNARKVSDFGQEATAGLRLQSPAQAQMIAEERAYAESMRLRNTLTQEVANSQIRLNSTQAETIVKIESLKRAQQAENNATLEAARAKVGMSQAQLAARRANEAQVRSLTQLRDRTANLNSAENLRSERLRTLISQEQRRAQIIDRVTARIHGAVSGQASLNAQINAGNQIGAAYRATLSGMNASFGSFASATVAVATGAYAVSAALRNVVSEGKDYQMSMSRIQALTGEIGEASETAAARMAGIENAVRQTAITSIFNAKETAEGFQYLAMSGMKASDAIDALPSALSLASVSTISMKESADMATNIMSGFNLKAKDMEHTVDVLAVSVTNSNTSMYELGNALSYIGPSASSAGFGLEEISSAIGVLANNGIKGSRAGTGLRGIITSLIEPSKKGAEALSQYGISITDMDGKTRPLVQILRQMQTVTKGMANDSQRLEFINKVFGRYAQSAASVLVGQADKVDEFIGKLKDVDGAAQSMADTIRDNLAGSYENLTSAMSDVGISAFKALEPVLRNVVMDVNSFFLSLSRDDVTQFVSKMFSLGDSLLSVGKAFVVFKGISLVSNGVLAVSGAMSTLVTGAKATVASVSQLGKAWNTTNYAMLSYSRTQAGVTPGFGVLNTQINTTTSGLGRLAAMAGVARTALSLIGSAAGWVGLLVGVGGMVYSLIQTYASDGKKELKEYDTMIDETKAKAAGLEALLKNQELKSRIGDTSDAVNTNQTELAKMIEKRDALMKFDAPKGSEDFKNSAIESLNRQIEETSKNLEKLKGQLTTLQATPQATVASGTDLGTAVLARRKAQEQLDEYNSRPAINAGYGNSSIRKSAELESQVQMWTDRIQQLTDGAAAKVRAAHDSGAAAATLAEADAESHRRYSAELSKVDGEVQAEVAKSQSVNSKLQDVIAERSALNTKYLGMLEGEDNIARYREQQLELARKQQQLQKQADEEESQYRRAKLSATRGEPTRKQLVNDESKLRSQINEKEKDHANNRQELTSLWTELGQVRSQRLAMDKSSSRAQHKEESEAAKAYKKALEVNQKMVESLDDGEAKVYRLYEERVNAIGTLFKKGTVAYTSAMTQAMEALDKERKKLSAYYKDGKALRDEYGQKSDYFQTSSDLSNLRYNRSVNQPMWDKTNDNVSTYMSEHRIGEAQVKQYESLTKGLVNPAGTAQLGDFQGLYDGYSKGYDRNVSYATKGAELEYGRNSRLEDVDQQVEIAGRGKSEQEKLSIAEQFKDQRLEIEQQYNDGMAQLAEEREATALASDQSIKSAQAGTASAVLKNMSQMVSDGSTMQKGLLVAAKAFSIAQSALATESAATQITTYGSVAAWQAMATYPGPAGEAMYDQIMARATAQAAMVRGMGYLNLAMDAASETASSLKSSNSGGSSSSSSSTTNNVTFAGFKDKGGVIGRDEFAIAGENGPEIIMGPANVVSTKDTANLAKSAMSGGNSSQMSITFAPVINMTSGAGATESETKQQGKDVSDLLERQFIDLVKKHSERGGVLSR